MKCFSIFLSIYLSICLSVYLSIYLSSYLAIHQGSLEVKLPTIWIVGKAQVGRVREMKRIDKIREEKEREGRRCRCAKRYESRDSPCCSNGLWLRRVENGLAAGAEPCCQIRHKKLHTVVARSTFRSQNVQNSRTTFRCGGQKCKKVEMSKKCTPLWREARVQVKSVKN